MVLIIDDCLCLCIVFIEMGFCVELLFGGFGKWGIDCFMKCKGISEMLLLFI